ncbi:MAG: archaeosine biosynthesis radical SAM protein RaSEA [Candidatus Hydrothermarchaeaceae archaeon]
MGSIRGHDRLPDDKSPNCPAKFFYACLNPKVMKEIRRKGLLKHKGRENAVFWSEKDFLDGPISAGVIILPTIGCRWGRREGCTMCGYVYDAAKNATQENIFNEFKKSIDKIGDVKYLKIFTSGSFLDPQEISLSSMKKILTNIPEHVRRVQIESRPEFISENVLIDIKGLMKAEFEIGIGLESANDRIRESINKGFTFDDFKKAARLCVKQDIKVKAYLLLKPPFLTEKEAISDVKNSIAEAANAGAERASVNPINVQKSTLVEMLWRRGEYRPPYLWSVVEILKWADENADIPVISHPTAAGKMRGAHNCKSCDREVYRGILAYSITQEPEHLEMDCKCKSVWKNLLELEQLKH